MPNLMKTFDELEPGGQWIARAMANAAREVLREHDIPPRNDDEAGRLDEACAIFYKRSEDTRRALT